MERPKVDKPEEPQNRSIRHAKMQATLKIVEWSRDDIEPGINGNPSEKYLALSFAFQEVYKMISAVVDDDAADTAEN